MRSVSTPPSSLPQHATAWNFVDGFLFSCICFLGHLRKEAINERDIRGKKEERNEPHIYICVFHAFILSLRRDHPILLFHFPSVYVPWAGRSFLCHILFSSGVRTRTCLPPVSIAAVGSHTSITLGKRSAWTTCGIATRTDSLDPWSLPGRVSFIR